MKFRKDSLTINVVAAIFQDDTYYFKLLLILILFNTTGMICIDTDTSISSSLSKAVCTPYMVG